MSSFLNKFTGSSNDAGNSTEGTATNSTQAQNGGGFMDKVNSVAGGGAQGEKNEDMLDKGELSPQSTTHRHYFS